MPSHNGERLRCRKLYGRGSEIRQIRQTFQKSLVVEEDPAERDNTRDAAVENRIASPRIEAKALRQFEFASAHVMMVVGLAILGAVVGVWMKLDSPSLESSTCWIAPYPPPCESDDDHRDLACENFQAEQNELFSILVSNVGIGTLVITGVMIIYLIWKKAQQSQNNKMLEKDAVAPSTQDGNVGGENRRSKLFDAVGSQKHVVIVEGESGTGKSRLIQVALEPYREGGARSRGTTTSTPTTTVFGTAKCERNSEQPLASLCECLAELCLGILENGSGDDQMTQQVSVELRANLDQEELELLANSVPEIRDLWMKSSSPQTTSEDEKNDSSSFSKEQTGKFKYICASLLRSISKFGTVALVVDDVQWMDSASLDIFKALVDDSSLKFFFAMSYRTQDIHATRKDKIDIEKSGEDEAKDAVKDWLEHLQERHSAPPLSLSETAVTTETNTQDVSQSTTVEFMSLVGWNESIITEMLSDLLRKEPEEVRGLATLMFERTQGNVFHVLQLLEYLQTKSLITKSTLTFQWEYDIATIREKTMVSDNLVQVLEANIGRLSSQSRACLQLCSCLGFRFEQSVLESIVPAILPDVTVECATLLKGLVQEGLIESLDAVEARYKFSHDQIHRSVLDSIHSTALNSVGYFRREEIHFRIGKVLWEQHMKPNNPNDTRPKKEWSDIPDRLLFLCVDQVNSGRSFMLANEESFLFIEMSKLNLAAAKRAASLGAFVPATEYCQIGQDVLQATTKTKDGEKGAWTNNYDLMLELHVLLAKVSLYSGQLEASGIARNSVLMHGRSIDDTIRAYQVLIDQLMVEDKCEEMINVSLEVLVKLGMPKIPKNPNRFQVGRLKNLVLKRLSRMSNDQILSLPAVKDERKAPVIRILSDLCYPAMQLGNFNLMTMTLCQLVETTLDCGIAGFSANGFAMIALQFAASDVELAYRMAVLADGMVKMETTSKASIARVTLFTAYVRHWREPYSQLLDRVLEGYNMGMRSGDSYAFSCVIGYAALYFYSGLTLLPLREDLKRFCALADEYSQKHVLLQLVASYQCVLNVSGESENILDLSLGEAKRYRKQENWNGKTGKETEQSYLMQIAFFCDEIDLAASQYKSLNGVELGVFRGVFFHQVRIFFFALIAMAKYKQKKHKHWKKEAMRHVDTIQGWVVQDKSINLVHKLMILKAELLTLDNKTDTNTICRSFDKAIVAASKTGYIQDAALAALVASRSLGETEDNTGYYRQRAMENLETWGAQGIIDYLAAKARNSGAKEDSWQTGETSSSLRSRERFSNSIVKQHQVLEPSELDVVDEISSY